MRGLMRRIIILTPNAFRGRRFAIRDVPGAPTGLGRCKRLTLIPGCSRRAGMTRWARRIASVFKNAGPKRLQVDANAACVERYYKNLIRNVFQMPLQLL